MVSKAPKAPEPGVAPSDAELVSAARSGEEWAQEALFRRYARFAFGLAHRVLPPGSEVEDLVQDAFLTAFERLRTLDNPQAFAAWLGSIVVLTARKRWRRQRLLTHLGLCRPEPLNPESALCPRADPATVAELRALFQYIGRFPPAEQTALLLRRIEGLGVAQIAECMQSSESTVKRRLNAADERLHRFEQSPRRWSALGPVSRYSTKPKVTSSIPCGELVTGEKSVPFVERCSLPSSTRMETPAAAALPRALKVP
jgi:RNA polymerase sigma-70 factor, ECF subfamily